MNSGLDRKQLEYAVQQLYGPIVGIEQATDEHLRKYLKPERRPVVHYNIESGRRSSGFMDCLDWLFDPFGDDKITRNDP